MWEVYALVDSQERLLNDYRCLFNVDTEVVPGGCVGGRPNPRFRSARVDAFRPEGFGPVAIEQMKAAHSVRVRLAYDQEILLNVYRCKFDVDTEVVPGGCAEGMPVVETEPPTALPNPETGSEPVSLPTSQTQQPQTSAYTIPVYYCGEVFDRHSPFEILSLGYDYGDLVDDVASLNGNVADFYRQESSGFASLRFTVGDVFRSQTQTWEEWSVHKVLEDRGEGSCYDLAQRAVGSTSVNYLALILVPRHPADEHLGAAFFNGPAVAAGWWWHTAPIGAWYRTIAHELGHALFHWEHPDRCSPQGTLMLSGTCHPSSLRLSQVSVSCANRHSAGWPC